MTRTKGAAIAAAALVAATAFPNAAGAQCSLENAASLEEIARGWTIHEDLRIVKQVDSAPYEQDGAGNWFVDRETTTLPICSVFDDLGGYSLRGYMLQPIVRESRVQICQATSRAPLQVYSSGLCQRPVPLHPSIPSANVPCSRGRVSVGSLCAVP